MPRPSVSVIVPFHGSTADATRVATMLAGLRRGPGDELLLVDNTADGAGARVTVDGVRVVAAPLMRSSYYARNIGAETATNAWLLFLDSDTRPPVDVIDQYFDEPVADDVGVVAGEVRGAEDAAFVPRFLNSRGHLSHAAPARDDGLPRVATANALFRARALADVGGFPEGVRSAGDFDAAWRIRDAGWRVVTRLTPVVEHDHPRTVRRMLRKAARYAAGAAWTTRRRDDVRLESLTPLLARAIAGTLAWTVLLRFERARFKAIDGIQTVVTAGGRLMGNVSADVRAHPGAAGDRPSVVVLSDIFPIRSETFVVAEARALERAGHRVRIESGVRAHRAGWAAARGLSTWFWEDEGLARKLADTMWLVGRHPVACLRDLRDRRRWHVEEPVTWPLRSLASPARRITRFGDAHLHAHFASGMALNALRLSRLLGVPYSVTAHAYDIFQQPRNLAEKLAQADFVTTGCDYNVAYLRGVPGVGDIPIARVIMGVDVERFRRSTPYPGGRRVVAVGRLVPKKGYDVLVDAVAGLPAERRPERVTIVGDGPEEETLRKRIAAAGVGDVVELVGALDPPAIHEALEAADVFTLPCVIAADGDRDSMPVAIKEAMSMEIPVIATDEVGIPEMVGPDRGVLVPPHDARALGAALADLLDRPAAERAAMGAAGRRWVSEHAAVDRETARLSDLIVAAVAAHGRRGR